MELINLTKHDVVLNSGEVFPKSGMVARVDGGLESAGHIGGWQMYRRKSQAISGLPAEDETQIYIVSAIVLHAANARGRRDCIAPASFHPDVVRDKNRKVVSVPGFII